MSFWSKSEFSYQSFSALSEEELMPIIKDLTREDLIEWLCWNDPNGIYIDNQSLMELGNIMTREEGVEILLRQIEENRVVSC